MGRAYGSIGPVLYGLEYDVQFSQSLRYNVLGYLNVTGAEHRGDARRRELPSLVMQLGTHRPIKIVPMGIIGAICWLGRI